MRIDNSLEINLGISEIESRKMAVPEPFRTELQGCLKIINNISNNNKEIEIGGHHDHPLSEQPTSRMNLQYQISRYKAILSLIGKHDQAQPIRYDPQLILPPYKFFLFRFFIQFVLSLKKLKYKPYSKIGLAELFYLYVPTHFLYNNLILRIKIMIKIIFKKCSI